jgi:hypothetical protein
MKNEIYKEIKRLENSSDDILKRKGKTIKILADNISCFQCIDTKKCLKNKNNHPSQLSLNNMQNYDIVGCYECNNVGLLCSPHTNNLTYNGFKLFNVNNKNWLERLEQLYNKASKDISIMNIVNMELNQDNHVKNELLSNKISTSNKSSNNDFLKNHNTIDQSSNNNNILQTSNNNNNILQTSNNNNNILQTSNNNNNILPLFEICKRIKKQYIENSLNVEIEIGKIINIVTSTVEAYFGNTFSLVDLIKELTISFTISDSKSISYDKLIKIKNNNYLGIKTCTKITEHIIKTGIFGKNKFAKEYTADIFILKPLNQSAIEKANMIMGKIGEEMTNDIFNMF